jgi:hypothetical protein
MTTIYPSQAHLWAIERGDTLHGYPVIASAPLPVRDGLRDGRVVIVDRISQSQPQRYVSAVHCYGDREWLHGDYCNTIEEAMASFTERLRLRFPVERQSQQESSALPIE